MDIDIAKFFDHVNHDILMRRIAQVISDKRILRLIGRYLRAGVLLNGVLVKSEEGTPQGGPLSPLLANIYLDALDRELEKRGLSFCRYADDCNIYVSSEAAAKRVLVGIWIWIEKHPRLLSGVSHQPPGAAGSGAAKCRTMQAEGARDLARLPQCDESAVTRRVAAVYRRLVGILPAGRGAARDFSTGGLDSAAHTEVLLAALAQCAGSMPRLAVLGRARVDAALCADVSWRVVCRGAGDDADGLVKKQFAALWIRDAIGSCGKQLSRRVQPPDRENRTSGGVGGCRGAIPGTRPDRGTV